MTYTDVLEQEQAGKTPDEKRVILAQECRKETDTHSTTSDPASVRHLQRMREICEEMTGTPISH